MMINNPKNPLPPWELNPSLTIQASIITARLLSHLLDTIFTNKKGLIDSIEYESPFRESDHSVLTFSFKCFSVMNTHTETKQNFVKTDYINIRYQLNQIQWHAYLKGRTANEK